MTTGSQRFRRPGSLHLLEGPELATLQGPEADDCPRDDTDRFPMDGATNHGRGAFVERERPDDVLG